MIRQLYNTYKYHIRSLYFWFPEPKVKFLILSMGRTGSTLLTSLLNSHSEVCCDSEIFMQKHHLPLIAPSCFLKGHTAKPITREKPVYGFKVKEEQLSMENKLDSSSFLHKLYYDNWKIIRLVRKNRIKLALSIYQAWEDNIYEVKKETQKISQIHVDLNKLIQILDFQDELYTRESIALEGIPHLTLSFEEDLLNDKIQQISANKVFDFLELTHQPVSTNFKKKSEDDLRILVENYDEMAEKLKNTKYLKFLYE